MSKTFFFSNIKINREISTNRISDVREYVFAFAHATRLKIFFSMYLSAVRTAKTNQAAPILILGQTIQYC